MPEQIDSNSAIQGKPPLKGEPRAIRWDLLIAVLAFVFVLALGGLYWRSRAGTKLTDQDTIILADFTNRTGDPVFDDTLRQGLAVQLGQSPFLSVIPDEQIAQTLQLMRLPGDTKLLPDTTREVCRRTGTSTMINGAISNIGIQYNLILKAVACDDGHVLASTGVNAEDKNQVLRVLGDAASQLRKQLGESRTTLQRFDTPLEQATTRSLLALQAYSLGMKDATDPSSAIPFFRRAIELDPNFALAYMMLGISYADLGENQLVVENTTKAFSLREGVSERERLWIDSHYQLFVHGNGTKAQQIFGIWSKTYPRDSLPHHESGMIYLGLGQFQSAVNEFLEAIRLDPKSTLSYCTLAFAYAALNRFDDALATAQKARDERLESPFLEIDFYLLAFLRNDTTAMERQIASATGQGLADEWLLAYGANTAAYYGRLVKANALSFRAIDLAERSKNREAIAQYQGSIALSQALYGHFDKARQSAAAVKQTNARDEIFLLALTYSLTDAITPARELTDRLQNRFPEDIIAQSIYIPAVKAQIALIHNEPLDAIKLLEKALPYELSGGTPVPLYPAYLRGLAHLRLRQTQEAAAEFQKILDHRGIVLNSPLGALGHLQLGRAYAMEGDTIKAKAAYQDFLTLWKDADPDIPILKQAKVEYAKLN